MNRLDIVLRCFREFFITRRTYPKNPNLDLVRAEENPTIKLIGFFYDYKPNSITRQTNTIIRIIKKIAITISLRNSK